MGETIQIKRKIVIIGDPMVGKTSLIRKFVLDVFSDDYITTIGTKITRKKLEYPSADNNSKIELSLMIWDIMGQTSLKLAPESAFHGSRGGIMVFDLTRSDTLDHLKTYIESLKRLVFNIPLIIVANKHDLEDKIMVKREELEYLARKYNVPFFYTSAKTGENVESTFEKMGSLMLKKQGIKVAEN